MNRPYQDTQTGCWNGIEPESEIDRIPCYLHDDVENIYPALVEVEITGDEITVVSVQHSANVPLNNPQDDINDSIKARYPHSTISYQEL